LWYVFQLFINHWKYIYFLHIVYILIIDFSLIFHWKPWYLLSVHIVQCDVGYHFVRYKIVPFPIQFRDMDRFGNMSIFHMSRKYWFLFILYHFFFFDTKNIKNTTKQHVLYKRRLISMIFSIILFHNKYPCLLLTFEQNIEYEIQFIKYLLVHIIIFINIWY